MNRSLRPSRIRPAILAALAGTLLTLAACGSDDEASPTTEAPATAAPTTEAGTVPPPATTAPAVTTPVTEAPSTTAETETTLADTTPATDAPMTTEAPATTAAPDTTVASTEAPTTTAAPDALQSVPGMAAVLVAVAGDDATRPTYSWEAPATAVSYQLVVQTADGAPMWAWIGDTTEVVLGGEARPADVEGPTLTGPSRVRVYAFDAANLLVAVSAWTPAG